MIYERGPHLQKMWKVWAADKKPYNQMMFENINMFNVNNNVCEMLKRCLKMSRDAQDHQLGEDPNGDVWSVRQCLSCSIKTSVSLTSTSASTQSLVHNQWRGAHWAEHHSGWGWRWWLYTKLATQSMEWGTQWAPKWLTAKENSTNKWENKHEHKEYKIQKNWSQSMGILGNGCVCNREYQSTNIWKEVLICT